jgi:hypothetical protein
MCSQYTEVTAISQHLSPISATGTDATVTDVEWSGLAMYGRRWDNRREDRAEMGDNERADEAASRVKVQIRLEKFDGEWFPGAVPVEVIDLDDPQLIEES